MGNSCCNLLIETLLDVFTTDIAKTFTQRINGTSAYYANAMLKWQYGDDLIINDEGTAFHYATEDTTKKIDYTCILSRVL